MLWLGDSRCSTNNLKVFYPWSWNFYNVLFFTSGFELNANKILEIGCVAVRGLILETTR